MFTSALDILFIALAVSAILLTIFICVFLVYAILIARDVSKITEKAQDITEKINDVIIKPIQLVRLIGDNIQPIIDIVRKKIDDHKKDKK